MSAYSVVASSVSAAGNEALKPQASTSPHTSMHGRYCTPRQLAALLAAAGWIACSCSIILLNRKLLVELHFHYPFALSAWGQILSGALAWASRAEFQSSQVSLQFYLRRVVPVGIAQGIGIYLSNNLYLLLTVSFIEMARSMLPLFILGALWLAGLENPNAQLIQSAILTVLGSSMSAYGEVKLSWMGLLFLGLNFGIEGVRMVMTQYLLQSCDCNPTHILMMLSWPSAMSLVALSLLLESGQMLREGAGAIVLANWPIFLAAGAVSSLSGYLSSLIIKLQGATMLKLLAAVRGPMLVLSGVVLLAETVTWLQLAGYSLALIGFVSYNVTKARQDRARSVASQRT